MNGFDFIIIKMALRLNQLSFLKDIYIIPAMVGLDSGILPSWWLLLASCSFMHLHINSQCLLQYLLATSLCQNPGKKTPLCVKCMHIHGYMLTYLFFFLSDYIIESWSFSRMVTWIY